jgi:hypothetical protein
MKRAELQISQIHGENSDVFRVSIVAAGRKVIAKFELPPGELMKALTGRLTPIELTESFDQ